MEKETVIFFLMVVICLGGTHLSSLNWDLVSLPTLPGGRPQISSSGVPVACPGVVPSTAAEPLTHLAPSPCHCCCFPRAVH